MMGVAAKNDKACMDMSLTEWYKLVQRQKKEAEIRKEYEERIEAAQKRLFDYKQSMKGNSKGVLMKQAAKGDAALVQEVYFLLKKEVEDKRLEEETQRKMKEMEAKMKGMADKNKENTKSVLMRNLAASDNMLCDTCLEAWKSWLVDYKKNKDEEDAIKAQEQKMEEFMKNKKDGAKGIIDKMNSATDSGLVEHVMSTWAQFFKDEQKSLEMQALMEANAAKFANFNERNKQGAKSAGAKATEVRDFGLVNHAFILWCEAAKVERLLRYYSNRIEAKKHQLVQLQGMFRGFANHLETSLKETPRDAPAIAGAKPPTGKRLSKSDQTASLPDIHKTPGSQRSGSGRGKPASKT